MVSCMLTEAIKTALTPFNDYIINENSSVLRSLKQEMDSLNKSVASITMKVYNLRGSFYANKKKETNFCLTQLEQMQWKCRLDLEDWSLCSNVRLVNLPTGIEEDDPDGFLQKMLPKWIPDLSVHSCPIEIPSHILKLQLALAIIIDISPSLLPWQVSHPSRSI